MVIDVINITDLMGEEWDFLKDQIEDPNLHWVTYSSKRKSHAGNVRFERKNRVSACFSAAKYARGSSGAILISHLPNMAIGTNIARFFIARHIPQIAFSFNFTDIPTGLRAQIYRTALQHIHEFVVFSNYERGIYSKALSIPEERIKVLKWAMDAPVPGPRTEQRPREPYICAIGGEARDYALLAKVMRRLPHRRAEIVARPYSMAGIDLPDNVTLHVNLPSDQTWRLAVDSIGMVLPLRSRDTACGHITFVAAQLLGVPLVVTDCLGLSDYITPETVFRAVPPKDVDALTDATEALFEQQDRAQAIATYAQAEAQREYSLNNWVAYLRDAINRLVVG